MILRALIFSASLFLIGLSHVADADELDVDMPVSAELKHALDLWLADDDAASLPALSELARNGDRAARLFLALAERTRLGASDFVEGLSREELLDLFRPPKGDSLFRPSWIEHLAREGDPLAVTLRESHRPQPNREAVTTLLAAGEAPAAMIGVRYLSLYGTRADREVLLNGPFSLHGLRAFVLGQHLAGNDKSQGLEVLREMARYGSGRAVANDDSDASALATYLVYGFPFGSAAKTNPWREDMAAWLENAEPARPISAFCKVHCGQEVADCGIAALGFMGGYYVAVRLASPLEAVVPSSVYAESARASGTILRRLARLESEKGGEHLATVEEIAKQSRCVAALVENHRNALAAN